MKRVPYTQKTLKLLRERGYLAQVVEKWQPNTFRRIDLFGIIDIVAIRDGEVLGVQSTSMGARLEHVKKITGECREQTLAWMRSGAKFLLVCWKKKKKVRGGKAFTYIPHEEDLKEALREDAPARSDAELLPIWWKKEKKKIHIPYEEDLKEALNLSASTDAPPDREEASDCRSDDCHTFSEDS